MVRLAEATSCSLILILALTSAPLFAAEPQYAAPESLRVFADGTLPNDARLKPLRTLNDKYHPWVPPASKEGFEREREAIRRQILVSNGLWPLPEKTPLQPVIHGERNMGDYTISKVYFETRPGLYLTGSLYRPVKKQNKYPAVLCPHGHWANGRFYDAGDKPAADQIASGAEKFDAGAHSPLQARMVHLARMGCIVFHYDMVGYADQPGVDHRTGFNDVESAQWLHSKMGLQTWNSLRALDFIAALPEVDQDRIAVTGASGGGTQTFILCALDPRPAICFPAVMVGTAMQGGCNCENANYMRIGVNNVAFAAAFAPKPMALSGADDWTIDIESKGLPELKQVYGYYGAADMVAAKCYPQFGHNYNQVSREMMYAWFRQHLNLGDAPVTESDFQRLTQAEMTVFDAEHPKPGNVLDGPAMREALTRQSREQLAAIKTDADYERVIGGAAEVMLFRGLPHVNNLEVKETGQSEIGGYSFLKGTVSNKADGSQIPTAVLLDDEKFNGQVVLWLDGMGKQRLFNWDGGTSTDVSPLLDKGFAVAGADLFLTGELTGPDNPLTYQVNESDPCYTFCYNRPLIAQRVRDILTVVAAIRQNNKVKQVHLVGTGGAGAWAVLARAMMESDEIGQTIADLDGFEFGQVTGFQDPNLLPGALKYGGLPMLTGLSPKANISIYGTTPVAWQATQSRFKQHGGMLEVHEQKLATAEMQFVNQP